MAAIDVFEFGEAFSPPAPTGITPAFGPSSGGTAVVIDGINFTGVTAVYFGDTSASFSVVSDIVINATTPARTEGVTVVSIVGPGGIGELR
jgi:hypothetical protein